MRKAILSVIAVAALAVCASTAFAAEISREEYVARVEPICKTNTTANARIFNGAKGEVQAGKLEKASKRFGRAVTAFDKTIKQISAVPKPAADSVKLTKWIGYLKAERDLLARIGDALGDGDKHKAQTLSVRLNRNSNLANNTILGFDFDYCRIDPSRFS
ncbi:MAG TPA: hypothetical protein VD761_00015 [Solirubrobacterales bacterium]|nr:hypothetical protein [Solirubrobacterales bacterium]